MRQFWNFVLVRQLASGEGSGKPALQRLPFWSRFTKQASSWLAAGGRIPAPAWVLALAVLLAGLPAPECLGGELGAETPSLQITNWMKGIPVDLKRDSTNKVHVIVFWETYCDSCMASLPQIVEMQTKMRSDGVEFVGVSAESPEVVGAFLTNSDLGPKLNFAIACDANRKTFDSYMTAFGQYQVPRAFVVDQRKALVWYGHPLAGLEYVLQQIVGGRFDFEAAKKTLGAEKLQEDYFRLAATNSNSGEVRKLGRKIVADGAGNPWLLNNFAWRILQDWRLEKRDTELAVQASSSACVATDWKRPTFLDTHALALFSNGDVTEAIRWQKQALALCTNDALRGRLEQSLKTFQTGKTNQAAH